MNKRKVAVLGSGMSAMSAVFELLKSDNFEGNYEITVYQMGWRIGGKGASGREKVPDYSDPLQNNQRILEHGLHAWFGWYDNAFHQFQECYTHLNWGKEHRFNTWDKAFTPEDNVVIMQSIHNGTQWQGWEINVPAIPGEPGNTVELPSLQEYHQILIQKIHSFFIGHPIGKKYAATSTKMHEGLFEKGKELIEHLFERVVEDSAGQVLKTIENLIASNQKELRKTLHPVRGQIISLIDHFLRWLYNIIGDECDQNFETQKFFTLIDCGLAIVKGLIADNVLYNGLNSINSLDFKEWLKMHGATDVTLNSALVRTVYDSCFAYRKGIKQYPDLEAGVALRICFGIALGSREHWIWKMNAGMGDTIFSPYYQVLRSYGVRFEFFHKVKELKLSDDKGFVEEIRMERQAMVKPELEHTGYEPTFFLGGIDCWPSEPFYDQLVEGEELKHLKALGKNVSLESFWSEWPGCADESKRNFSLKRRTNDNPDGDFDVVILNIPIAAHIYVCSDFVKNNPRWLDSLINVQTNQTFAVQLWMNNTTKNLGWDFSASCMTAFWEPVDTFCDMTHLLQAENWNPDNGPKQITYLVGPYPDQPVIPLKSQHFFPSFMTEKVKYLALRYILDHHICSVFKHVDKNGVFNWDLLFDDVVQKGEQRFESQYWHINVDPWERYTLSLKGSSAYRLRADESGYANLFFSGDWTDNGVNAGCIEACVVAGKRCAAAISGKNILVIGDNSLYQMM